MLRNENYIGFEYSVGPAQLKSSTRFSVSQTLLVLIWQDFSQSLDGTQQKPITHSFVVISSAGLIMQFGLNFHQAMWFSTSVCKKHYMTTAVELTKTRLYRTMWIIQFSQTYQQKEAVVDQYFNAAGFHDQMPELNQQDAVTSE